MAAMDVTATVSPSKVRLYVATAAILVVIYAALVIALARTRKPWNDEAMSASAGLTLATKGYLAIPSFDEHDPGMQDIHRRMYYIMPLQMIVMAPWYKIVGFSLFTTRMLAALWAIVYFYALYRLVKLFSGNSAIAWLAVALTAFDYQIISSAAFGRYDTMVAALGFSAYALFMVLRQRRFLLAMLASNACVVAAGLTHPNGLVYFLGLWFLILYYDWRSLRFKHLAIAAVPYLVGGAAWGLYILQDVPAFKAQLFGNTGNRVALWHPWKAIQNELEYRWIRPYGLGAREGGGMTAFYKVKAIAILGYLAGVFGCLAIPSLRSRYRAFLMLAGIHFLYFTFYEGMKFNYYLVHLLPFYLSALAIFAHFLWTNRPALRFAVAAGVAALALVAVGGILMKVRVNDMRNSYDPAVAFIKQNAGPNDMMFAACSFGFGVGFGPDLVDDAALGYYSGLRPRFIVMEEIYRDNVDIFRARDPKVYQYYLTLISGYRPVYDWGDYKIYERTSAAAPVAASSASAAGN